MEFRIQTESAQTDSAYTLSMLRALASSVRPRRADGPAAMRRWLPARLRGTIDQSAVDSIANAIQTQEGYYPGSVAYANNNPGNLAYVGQPGAVAGTGGFAKFATYQDGYAALENQITLDATRGTDVNGNPTTTLSQLITSWAPPSENNTAAYIANVSAATGFDPNASLSSLASTSSAFTDASTFLDQTVNLSSVGISSPVPIYWLIGAGLVGMVLLRD